jgi:hypothetical protein
MSAITSSSLTRVTRKNSLENVVEFHSKKSTSAKKEPIPKAKFAKAENFKNKNLDDGVDDDEEEEEETLMEKDIFSNKRHSTKTKEPNENMSLKTGVTRNFQYLNQISNTVAATPIDFWKSTDLHFKPIRSDNAYLGFYQDFANNKYEFSSEIYYSKLSNTQEYKDFADLLGNESLETEILFGRGKNYGLELSLKKLGGKVSGNVSYTLSRSLRQINNVEREMINFGNWYPSLVDKPHNLNMLVNFNVTKRLSFNFNFAYISGRPLTVPVNKFEELNVGNILFFGDRNSYRMPDYHRLDFSLNLLPSYNIKKKVKQSWNFTVLNLYARRNPYSVFFRQNNQEPLTAFKYSILGTMLPSLSLNLEIK